MTISSLQNNEKIQNFLEIIEFYSSRITRERDLIIIASTRSDKRKLKKIQEKLKESQEKFSTLEQDPDVKNFILLCNQKENPSDHIQGIIASLRIITEYQNRASASMPLGNSSDDLSGAAYGNVRSEAFRAEASSGISLPAGTEYQSRTSASMPLGNSSDDLSGAAYGNVRSEAFRAEASSGISLPARTDSYENYKNDSQLKNYSSIIEQTELPKARVKIFVPHDMLKHLDEKERILDYLEENGITSFLTPNGKYGVRICRITSYDPDITDPAIIKFYKSVEFFKIEENSTEPKIPLNFEERLEIAKKVIEGINIKDPDSLKKQISYQAHVVKLFGKSDNDRSPSI